VSFPRTEKGLVFSSRTRSKRKKSFCLQEKRGNPSGQEGRRVGRGTKGEEREREETLVVSSRKYTTRKGTNTVRLAHSLRHPHSLVEENRGKCKKGKKGPYNQGEHQGKKIWDLETDDKALLP